MQLRSWRRAALVGFTFLVMAMLSCTDFGTYVLGITSSAFAQEGAEGTSWLAWAFRALGAGYSLIFLALSFTLGALVVMNILTARRDNVCPASLVDGFEANRQRMSRCTKMIRRTWFAEAAPLAFISKLCCCPSTQRTTLRFTKKQ